jgi:hypothetical protein
VSDDADDVLVDWSNGPDHPQLVLRSLHERSHTVEIKTRFVALNRYAELVGEAARTDPRPFREQVDAWLADNPGLLEEMTAEVRDYLERRQALIEAQVRARHGGAPLEEINEKVRAQMEAGTWQADEDAPILMI